MSEHFDHFCPEGTGSLSLSSPTRLHVVVAQKLKYVYSKQMRPLPLTPHNSHSSIRYCKKTSDNLQQPMGRKGKLGKNCLHHALRCMHYANAYREDNAYTFRRIRPGSWIRLPRAVASSFNCSWPVMYSHMNQFEAGLRTVTIFLAPCDSVPVSWSINHWK
jgi:hypothetical protein